MGSEVLRINIHTRLYTEMDQQTQTRQVIVGYLRHTVLDRFMDFKTLQIKSLIVEILGYFRSIYRVYRVFT